MKTNQLQSGYYMFGNKGTVWANEAHIAENSAHVTLCGTPMLSSNWARIENLEEVNCPKCLEVYGKPDATEWNLMMNAIKQKQHQAISIPERFGEYMIDHFTNTLPPIVWGDKYVLCSEPYDYDQEQDAETFIGFYRRSDIYYGIITTVDNFKLIIK